MTPKTILKLLLAVFAVAFVIGWSISLTRRRQWRWPGWLYQLIGFVTNFFDTLGIGSYATTTAAYRLTNSVHDDDLPGTLNIGHCIPIIVQAYLYMTAIEVDDWTLALMIISSVLGAWLGAAWVVRLSKRMIQLCLGLALLAAACLMLGGLFNFLPSGGTDLGLHGVRLLIGLIGSFIFGALMMIGVGAYAPTMIMISLLGMNPKTAFPIMMGSCAFLTPVGSIPFLQKNKYSSTAALGLTLGGIPAVVAAYLLVNEMSLGVIRWLVVFIAIYTAVGLLRAARRSSPAEVPSSIAAS